jgi:hypothetical protein
MIVNLQKSALLNTISECSQDTLVKDCPHIKHKLRQNCQQTAKPTNSNTTDSSAVQVTVHVRLSEGQNEHLDQGKMFYAIKL